jgi:hypothetical protein
LTALGFTKTGFDAAGFAGAAAGADVAKVGDAGRGATRDLGFEVVVVAMVAAPLQVPDEPGSFLVALQHET